MKAALVAVSPPPRLRFRGELKSRLTSALSRKVELLLAADVSHGGTGDD